MSYHELRAKKGFFQAQADIEARLNNLIPPAPSKITKLFNGANLLISAFAAGFSKTYDPKLARKTRKTSRVAKSHNPFEGTAWYYSDDGCDRMLSEDTGYQNSLGYTKS